MTTYYPPNLFKKLAPINREAFVYSASSLHPGGVNVLIADGSARFIAESVDTWPSGEAGGPVIPPGGPFPPRGVWQALGTRNGGEVIGATNY